MAELITKTQLENASLDADSLALFVNGDKTVTVVTREGKQYPSLSKFLENHTIADKTFYITSSDPTGEIAGIAGTTNGEIFRVPQGTNAANSFKYYLNNNGTSEEIANLIGSASVKNTIRIYFNESDAQSDISSGLIDNNSLLYIYSDLDNVAFGEYKNVNGNLEPTGKTVATNEAIDNEILERKRLISDNVSPGVLSLLDDNGYEAGKITDKSFEVEKLKIEQVSSGPLLGMSDKNGYGVQILSEDGALMAGRNKFSEVADLLSVIDKNGYVVKILDSIGRLFAGRNILFDIKNYAFCILDSNGWVIWAIDENGYTISRDSGVEPTPSILETSALGHWLFGYEDTSYQSRVSSQILTPQSPPSFNKNYISVLPWAGALISQIPDASEYTICAVVRVPTQASQTDNVVIYGTQNGYSLRDDDNTYKGVQLSMFSDRDSRRWLRSKISDYRGTSRNWLDNVPPVGEWVFISHIVKVSGSGKRYQVIKIGNGYWQELREADSDKVSLSDRNIAVGNAYCDVASFKTKNLEIAEFIYFDRALLENEVNSVYNNSKVRMSERSINLK